MPVPTHRSIRYLAAALLLPLVACDYPEFVPTEFLDGARKSEDIALFLAVQRADQVTSGNATLGEAGPIGRSGSMRLSVRASTAKRATPNLTGVPIEVGEGEHATLPVEESNVTTVAVDGALSLWRGFDVGETHFGGINLLGRLAFMNGYDDNPLDIGSDGNLSLGIGVRMGLFEETAKTPGISISWMYHKLPKIDFASGPLPTTDNGTMSLTLNSLDVDASQLRAAISKHFGAFGVTAGYGSDQLSGESSYSADRTGPGGVASHAWNHYLDGNRSVLFLGGSYRVGRFTLAGELGRLSGNVASFTNGFANQDDWQRSYVSVGVSVGN